MEHEDRYYLMMMDAVDGELAAGDVLESVVGIGIEAQREHVDAQLHRGRNLVDVLPARPAGGDEFLLRERERALDDLTHR